MAEEHRFQSPEGHRLCANNCGFFGSPATQNLCSKCYRDLRLKEEQASSAKMAVEKSLNGGVALPNSSSTTSSSSSSSAAAQSAVSDGVFVPSLPSPAAGTFPSAMARPNRCSSCGKRVGLTGFPCRCGATFCGSHRYPEQHDCSFDFKSVGRDAIAKANPVVKAPKLDKI